MPYISQAKRPEMKEPLDELAKYIKNGGDLNYCFSMICKNYIFEKGQNYENYATLISSLECAKLEYYRRQIAPYEDIKIVENGDI